MLSDRFSGVVSVVHEGRSLIEHAAGLARRDSGEVIRQYTRFGTASISKMFTAVCIARLMDRRMCRLDQPVVEFVPHLKTHFDSSVTLDSLLSHRSGLGDYIDDDALLPFAHLPVEQLVGVEAFLPLVIQVDRFQFGTFRYSSAGYILLGLAIEALTGRPFAEAIREWVLDPAGLQSTGFGRVDDLAPDFAHGYMTDGRSNVEHLPPIGGPDGGIVTCVEDLRRFFDWLKHGDSICADSRRNLWERVSVVNDREAYGRGFEVVTACDREWCGHTGSDPGVSARAVFARESDSSVIVLSNHSSIAFRIFRLIMEWLESDGLPPNYTLQLTSSARG